MKLTHLSTGWNPHIGLLLLRIVLGIVFLAHGWAKLSGMEGTIAFFGKLGLAPFMAYVVAYIETIGGIMMILGLWTLVPALGFIAIMIGVLFTAKAGSPFMGQNSYEFELTLLVASLAVAFLGSGKYSLTKPDTIKEI